MDEQRQRFVRDALEASVTELFDAYGVTCDVDSREPGQDQQLQLGSLIGFRGKRARGGLAFVAPAELISHLLPVPTDERAVELQLRDWTAEIANQLLGRLKNKLSVKAIDFDTGTAVCFTGMSVRLVFLSAGDGMSITFRAGDAALRVHLDCSIALDMTDVPVEDLHVVAEGDVILF